MFTQYPRFVRCFWHVKEVSTLKSFQTKTCCIEMSSGQGWVSLDKRAFYPLSLGLLIFALTMGSLFFFNILYQHKLECGSALVKSIIVNAEWFEEIRQPCSDIHLGSIVEKTATGTGLFCTHINLFFCFFFNLASHLCTVNWEGNSAEFLWQAFYYIHFNMQLCGISF